MATISRNFDGVVIEADGSTVRVTGTTTIDGEIGNEPPDVTIYVSIVGLPGGREPLVAPADLSDESPWPALFPDAAAALEGSLSVHAMGVAVQGAQPPFVWTDVLPLGTKQ